MKHKDMNDECDEFMTHTSGVKPETANNEETVGSFTRHSIAHNDRFPIHHLLDLVELLTTGKPLPNTIDLSAFLRHYTHFSNFLFIAKWSTVTPLRK